MKRRGVDLGEMKRREEMKKLFNVNLSTVVDLMEIVSHTCGSRGRVVGVLEIVPHTCGSRGHVVGVLEIVPHACGARAAW